MLYTSLLLAVAAVPRKPCRARACRFPTLRFGFHVYLIAKLQLSCRLRCLSLDLQDTVFSPRAFAYPPLGFWNSANLWVILTLEIRPLGCCKSESARMAQHRQNSASMTSSAWVVNFHTAATHLGLAVDGQPQESYTESFSVDQNRCLKCSAAGRAVHGVGLSPGC